jgi:hypothetical protein
VCATRESFDLRTGPTCDRSALELQGLTTFAVLGSLVTAALLVLVYVALIFIGPVAPKPAR